MLEFRETDGKAGYIYYCLFTVYILLLGIVVWNMNEIKYDDWMNSFSSILFISFVLILLPAILGKIHINCLSLLFIFLSFIFHLSHILLIRMNYDFGDTIKNIPFIRYDPDSAMKAFNMGLLSICIVFWGMKSEQLFRKTRKKTIVMLLAEPRGQFTFGLCLLSVAMPFFIAQTAVFLLNTARYGYMVAANFPQNSYVRLMGEFLLPAFLLMMTAPEIKTKTSGRIVCFGCAVYFVSMLTGQRAYNLMYMAILLWIYLSRVRRIKIKIKSVIVGAISVYIFSLFLSLIRQTRTQGMSMELLFQNLRYYNKNPVLDMVNEFAITGNIVTHVVREKKIPVYGQQLAASFLITIPGISKLFPVDWGKYNLTDNLGVWNLGGSYIADFYYDFGYGVYLACAIWGWCLNRIFTWYYNILERKRYFEAAFMSPVICEILFSVRSTTYKIPRTFFFYAIIFLFMYCSYILVESIVNKSHNG